MNILFVCSQNKWRSKTAETIFKNDEGLCVKSAGTEKGARIRITENLLTWSDLIFVMEKRHKERLFSKYEGLVNDKKIIILDIPDDYKYMDEELVSNLRDSVAFYLNQ